MLNNINNLASNVFKFKNLYLQDRDELDDNYYNGVNCTIAPNLDISRNSLNSDEIAPINLLEPDCDEFEIIESPDSFNSNEIEIINSPNNFNDLNINEFSNYTGGVTQDNTQPLNSDDFSSSDDDFEIVIDLGFDLENSIGPFHDENTIEPLHAPRGEKTGQQFFPNESFWSRFKSDLYSNWNNFNSKGISFILPTIEEVDESEKRVRFNSFDYQINNETEVKSVDCLSNYIVPNYFKKK